MGSSRWLHTADEILKDHIIVPNPSKLTGWVDEMKLWPGVSHIDIINYFVFSEGGDREEMRNYKSTEAFNYFHSNKVGRIFLCKHEDYVFLKAEVDRSQSANHKVIAWVMLQPSGLIETVGCSCMAGLGRSCSHAAAILWKV
jgi:hypothetical protein